MGPSAGRAQDRFAAEAFEPAPAVEGSVVNVHGARTLAPRAYTLTAYVSYGRKILSVESENNGNTLGELIGSMGTLSLMGTVGLWKHLDIGVALPLHRVSKGSEFVAPAPPLAAVLMQSTELAVGDIRLVPRVNLLARENGVALALLAPIYLPTGKDEYYAGEAFRIEPRVSVDWLSRHGLLLAMNVGYMVRSEARVLGAPVDDMLKVGVGADIPIAYGLSALAEVDSQFNVLGEGFGKANAPTEGLAGLRFRKSGWLAQLGAGPGLVRGITAPRYRLFASVSYSHVPPPDRDDDDIPDNVDRCPDQPEDKDGFQDADGCPEPDNDGDGVPDAQDRCANEPEDADGFQDADGCPDPDNDGDGVLDASDRCADEREDQDGFEDTDGCPDPDNDGDGVPDASDRCPTQAEDNDGFQDDDGCPEPDNDGDSVLDPEDECPNEPGPTEHNGCPQVSLTEETIELRQPVFFALNQAVLEPHALPILDEVANVLKAHPEITQVSVEGHTDATGTLARNRWLSRARAAAVVKALIQRGISPKRLRAAGHGPDQPLDSNETEEGRAKNRRVHMHVEGRKQ